MSGICIAILLHICTISCSIFGFKTYCPHDFEGFTHFLYTNSTIVPEGMLPSTSFPSHVLISLPFVTIGWEYWQHSTNHRPTNLNHLWSKLLLCIPTVQPKLNIQKIAYLQTLKAATTQQELGKPTHNTKITCLFELDSGLVRHKVPLDQQRLTIYLTTWWDFSLQPAVEKWMVT